MDVFDSESRHVYSSRRVLSAVCTAAMRLDEGGFVSPSDVSNQPSDVI
jgi:hypothetical protein